MASIYLISEGQNHHCAYCGVVMLTRFEIKKALATTRRPGGAKSRAHWMGSLYGRRLTRDHVIPQCHGGPDGRDNEVAACDWCNNYRGNQPAEAAFERIQRLVRRGTHPHLIFAREGIFPNKGYQKMPTVKRPHPAVIAMVM